MPSMKKRILRVAGLILAAGLVWGTIYLNSLLPIITGYPAKYLCSAVFVSGRNPADAEASELNFSFIRYVTNEIDYCEKSVTSRFLWGRSKAVWRDGFGCTLLRNKGEAELRKIKFPVLSAKKVDPDTMAWPCGNAVPDSNTGIDRTALARISDSLMAGTKYHGNAFAFLVLHKGIPVAERYRQPEFNATTRFLSWSMAKSFTNALAGIMVKEGLLDIYQEANIQEWRHDARKKITLNDLMQMQSGLRWNEDYGNRSDVTLMLYDNDDFAQYALKKPPEFPPGSRWYYSSGSTNIVNYLMRARFGDDSTYYTYAPSRLFHKIGMPEAVFETDPAGVCVGSSYIFATARGFARFGLLYLYDGVFNGERILPEGWVKYSTTPASQSRGNYGSFFWLNRGGYYPSAPADMYFCNGHDGQRIFIIPSQELVVVVLGHSPKPANEMDFNQLLKDILGVGRNGEIAK